MLICLVVLFVAFVAYVYVHDPSGCEKLLNDARSVLGSISPVSPQSNAAPPTPAAPVPPAQPTAVAPAPASVSAVPNPPPPPSKAWAAPDVMPSQPNWTWTASDGTTYQNVVVTEIGPETVTITHSMGVAHVSINLLPPDIQKQLNYNPHAASHGN